MGIVAITCMTLEIERVKVLSNLFDAKIPTDVKHFQFRLLRFLEEATRIAHYSRIRRMWLQPWANKRNPDWCALQYESCAYKLDTSQSAARDPEGNFWRAYVFARIRVGLRIRGEYWRILEREDSDNRCPFSTISWDTNVRSHAYRNCQLKIYRKLIMYRPIEHWVPSARKFVLRNVLSLFNLYLLLYNSCRLPLTVLIT